MSAVNLVNRALQLVDSLPLRDVRFTAPCLIGALLSEPDRSLAQVEYDTACDAGENVDLDASNVPGIRALIARHGYEAVRAVQHAHDDAVRTYGDGSRRAAMTREAEPAQDPDLDRCFVRREVLRMNLLLLRRRALEGRRLLA